MSEQEKQGMVYLSDVREPLEKGLNFIMGTAALGAGTNLVMDYLVDYENSDLTKALGVTIGAAWVLKQCVVRGFERFGS